MATHTICCTCGNFLHVPNAVAGAKKACSQCGKLWTIPDLPHLKVAEPAPKPVPRRILVESRDRSFAGPIVASILVVAAMVGGILLVRGGKAADGGPPPVAIRKPPPPVESQEPPAPFRASRTGDTAPVAPPSDPSAGALAVLVDPFRRTPPADRSRAAVELLGRVRRSKSPSALFMGGRYLSSSDQDWSLTPGAIDALQAYFKESKIVEIEAFDVARHLAALKVLAARIPEVRAKSPGSEALLMEFASAHAADSGAPVADVVQAAQGLGLRQTADGRRWGSEAAALRADLAMEAATGRARYAWKRFDEKLSHHDNFGIRYLGAWLLTLETLEKNEGGYDRLAAGWRAIAKGQGPGIVDHVGALAAGIEAAAKCTGCKTGRVACTRCGGDGKLDMTCARCDGKGEYDKGGERVMCRDCLGKGVFKDVPCGCARANNQIECPKCKGKTWLAAIPDPGPAKVATFSSCEMCAGLGMPPVGVAVTCADCFGLGKLLVPAADPEKTLR